MKLHEYILYNFRLSNFLWKTKSKLNYGTNFKMNIKKKNNHVKTIFQSRKQ